MLKSLALAGALLCAISLSLPSQARSHHHPHARAASYLASPECNVTMPCEGVAPSPRGLHIARRLGFGAAQMRYQPAPGAVVAHPAGCPWRAFCGCGAAVRIFGEPRRSLWLAAAWFRFPRAQPAAGMVAVRRHHVFVLEQPIGGSTWLAYDANSGGHATRLHARSIAGYTIVNPHG
jgi:hypothetical protein